MTAEALLSTLKTTYGWSNLRLAGRLVGGEWNDVWHLQTNDGDFVARIAPLSASPETIERSHYLMSLAASPVPGVFPPVPNLSGKSITELDGRLAAIFPFVHGRRAERGKIDPEMAGSWLGRLHKTHVSAPGQIPQDNFQIDPAYADALSRRGIDLASLRDQLDTWRGGLVGEPSGLIHGDYYPSNIIVDQGRIAGVVDWDEAAVGPLVWELGRALWEFAGDAEDASFDMNIARSFISGYTAAGGLEPDPTLLIGAMAQNRLWDALWAFEDPAGFEENLEYHLHHLRAMEWIQKLDF